MVTSVWDIIVQFPEVEEELDDIEQDDEYNCNQSS